jgi:hypothetical protein
MLAGETFIAGKIPGERIATTTETSNSSATSGTTELSVISVTAAVVIGRTYWVSTSFGLSASVAADDVQINIREDSVSGTIIQSDVIDAPIVNRIQRLVLEASYTADATENKTFVAALQRVAGTGTFTRLGSATRPAFLYVTYVSG